MTKPSHPVNILIVDDHQMFIDGLKTLLKNIGNIKVVAEALNGKQAIEILNKEQIDIVITDIEMPEMNGIELTKHIKQYHPEVKVLALTMYNDRQIVNEIIEAEAEGYILKNTGKQELIKAINKLSDNGTYYCHEVLDILTDNYSKKEEKKKEPEEEELTVREKEILQLVCQEYSTVQIADKLFISPLTVETHRKNIIRKSRTKTIVGLIKYAIENGLT